MSIQQCQGYNMGCEGEVSYVTYYFQYSDSVDEAGGAFLCENCIQLLHNSGAVVNATETTTA